MLPMAAIDELRRAFEQMPGVRLAVLFGSAAKGVAGPDSDLDVGVLLERGTASPPALGVALDRAAGRSVDLVWLDTPRHSFASKSPGTVWCWWRVIPTSGPTSAPER